MKHWLSRPLIHPLRNTLTMDDWDRIQEVIDQKIPAHNATLDELDAARDVFFDAYAAQKQTHEGILSMQ